MSIDFEKDEVQFISFDNSPALNNVAGGTVTAWVEMETVTGTHFLVNFSNNQRQQTRLALRYTTPNRTCIGVRLNGGASAFANGGAPAIGQKRWFAGTANYATRELLIYLNGVQAGSATMTDAAGNTDATDSVNVAIGALSTSTPGSFGSAFDGRLSDVRCYSRVLTAAEIQSMFIAKGRDSNVLSLQHRWKLNQFAPGVFADDDVVRDSGRLKIDGGAGGNGGGSIAPVYSSWITSSRRRRRAG